MNKHFSNLIAQYVEAKEIVINEGYADELDWQLEVDLKNNTESDFLREAAWVVLSSGMRESIVRSKFADISSAFLNFESSEKIIEQVEQCKKNAYKCFKHTGKINAIVSIVFRVFFDGYDSIQKSVGFYGVDFLKSLDYIGPATSFHLAKNIGVNVAKPDRHLCRVADIAGFQTVDDLCNEISFVTGDTVAIVDLVIWRFATLKNDYLSWFKAGH